MPESCDAKQKWIHIAGSNWAASWQNLQNGMCAQRRLKSALTSAQSEYSLSAWRMLPIERIAKTLIRLGGWTGWSVSSLGAQSFCLFGHEAAQFWSQNNKTTSREWQSQRSQPSSDTKRKSSKTWHPTKVVSRQTKNLLIWEKWFVWENFSLWLFKISTGMQDESQHGMQCIAETDITTVLS